MTIITEDILQGKAFFDPEWSEQKHYFGGVVVNHEGRISHLILVDPTYETRRNARGVDALMQIAGTTCLVKTIETALSSIQRHRPRLTDFLEIWSQYSAMPDIQEESRAAAKTKPKLTKEEEERAAAKLIVTGLISQALGLPDNPLERIDQRGQREIFQSFPPGLFEALTAYEKRLRGGGSPPQRGGVAR